MYRITSGESRAESGGRGERADRRGPRAPLTAHSGFNRFVWNLRVSGAATVPGMFISEIRGEGPMVPPGRYQVKLTATSGDYTAPLVIRSDPRVKVTPADLNKQYELGIQIRDRVTQIHATVQAIRNARASLENRRRANPNSAPDVDVLEREFTAIEGELIQVKSTNREASLVYPIMLDAQYADLGNVIESAETAPPAQVYEVFADYEKRWEVLQARWKSAQGKLAQAGE
jgi:hypothetical protein